MAKKLTEKQELLQFYKELMTDEHKTEDEYGNVTYSMTRPDGTSSSFTYMRPYKPGETPPKDWEEFTPELIVKEIQKRCKPRTFTQKELNASPIATQNQLFWIGEHRGLIPYLLDYAATDRKDFSCFREFIYWTQLRPMDYTKTFKQWWHETVNDPSYSEKHKDIQERDLCLPDRYVIGILPLAWIPESYRTNRKSETRELDLFSFLDDCNCCEIADYSDKPKQIAFDEAMKHKSFWVKVARGQYRSYYVLFKVERLERGKWQVRKIGTKWDEPRIYNERQMNNVLGCGRCSLQQLSETKTEFLM